ncbi:DUF4240 domain-containing protein [Streptomyces sp. NPDC005148]
MGGGCSDDRFSDFTAGLVALGREWHERATVCPDALPSTLWCVRRQPPATRTSSSMGTSTSCHPGRMSG